MTNTNRAIREHNNKHEEEQCTAPSNASQITMKCPATNKFKQSSIFINAAFAILTMMIMTSHFTPKPVLGFMPPSLQRQQSSLSFCSTTTTSSSSSTTSLTPLFLAKGGVHGKKTRMLASLNKKKRKKVGNNKTATTITKGKKNKKNKSTGSSSSSSSSGGGSYENDVTRASTKSGVTLPSTKSNAPPWKIMSAKDAQKNVLSEIERRERIKQGDSLPSSSSSVETNNKADASKSNRLLSETDKSLVSWKRFNPESKPSGVAFIGSYLGKKSPPSLGVPEIAFLGRSNVGKSSLLNKLSEMATKKKGGGGGGGGDKARVGKTPGATASVNLYALLGQPARNGGDCKPILGFADLPGFGYAKLSKDLKANVEIAAERYLGRRRELALGVLLVDARRVPSEDDRAVLAALYDMGVPLVVVATKIDKINGKDVEGALEVVRDGLGLPEGQPLAVSSVSGVGTRDLWRIVLDACEGRIEELKNEVGGGREGDGEEDEEDEEEFFEDGEDLVYDQGYDWVHGSSASIGGSSADVYNDDDYDDDDDDEYGWDGEDYDDEYNDDGMTDNQQRQAADKEFFKLKSLKKAARDMERRGDL